MRTIETKVYTIDELSDEAKRKAFSNYTPSVDYIHNEIMDTVEAFEKVFPAKLCEDTVRIDANGSIQELAGARLMAYVWNNYRNDLYKGKYYRVNTNTPIKHKRVVSKTYSKGNVGNYYYSAINKEIDSPLTGVCYDNCMLQPVIDCLNGKFTGDFEQLMRDCYSSIEKELQRGIDYCNSFEYFIEESQANDYEFTENGNLI